MELVLILVAIIVLLCVSQYLIFKHNRKLKNNLEHAEYKVTQYKNIIADTKELSKKSAEIDEKIEVKKNERKKLSKGDKIKLANNRTNNT